MLAVSLSQSVRAFGNAALGGPQTRCKADANQSAFADVLRGEDQINGVQTALPSEPSTILPVPLSS